MNFKLKYKNKSIKILEGNIEDLSDPEFGKGRTQKAETMKIKMNNLNFIKI